MLQTRWWLGPDDPVSIGDMVQSGVQGVVSALHCFPPEQARTLSQIRTRQNEISLFLSGKATGLKLDVVESLPGYPLGGRMPWLAELRGVISELTYRQDKPRMARQC